MGSALIYTDDWAFIHIPKTGGSNFKSRVDGKTPEIEGDWVRIECHNPVSFWETTEYVHDQYITIVRNPYSRMVSIYEHIKSRRGMSSTFKEFVTGPKKFFGNWGWNWPQVRWIEGSDNVKVFRMEDQLKDMEKFVGVEFASTNHNTGSYSDWKTYYTPELKDYVYDVWNEDFKMFNYGEEL